MPEQNKIIYDREQLFSKWGRWKQRAEARSSEAGEDREEIGELIEKTGFHKKAHSHAMQAWKMKKDEDLAEYLRSMDILLEQVRVNRFGNKSLDMIEADRKAEVEEGAAEAGVTEDPDTDPDADDEDPVEEDDLEKELEDE